MPLCHTSKASESNLCVGHFIVVGLLICSLELAMVITLVPCAGLLQLLTDFSDLTEIAIWPE